MGMKEKLYQAKATWKVALGNPYFRWQFIFSLFFLFAVMQHNIHFLNIWQTRDGIRLHDPVLNMLPPHDFSSIIFFFTYAAVLFATVTVFSNPGLFVRALQAYSIITMLRTASIYFFPLETPEGFIPLTDPLINFFLNKYTIVTKDLFFSGHTATLAFMFFITQNRQVKWFCFTALLVAPFLIMWQHVHYTADVVFAPVVAYSSMKLVDWMNHHHAYGKVLFEDEPVQ